jgi:DNA-binding NarL/FixJ family response regulator
MTHEIRLVIADDHPIVRKGLCSSIEEEPSLKVIGQAADGQEALALIQQILPDIAVLDIDMPKLGGLEVARELTKLKLQTKIIFLTLHKDEDMFRTAMDLGARGYLLKDSAMQEIVAGVQSVMSGRLYLSSALVSLLIERPTAEAANAVDPLLQGLTPAERRIFKLIADGRSSKEIGDDLSIHYRTVENHRTNICKKLGIEGANALLRFALQHRIMP